MKKIFTTIDVLTIVEELKELVIGLRVNQVYNIDNKTYLIKLQKPEHKMVLLLESASRIHTTDYDWPKSPAPSGFAMKLRKHLRNKRLESVTQLGVDRVVDLQFGSGELCNHLLVELYDRGNVVLTDFNYEILNVLRPRKEEETKILVRERYQIESARQARTPPTLETMKAVVDAAKGNVVFKKVLNPMLDVGGALIEHELLMSGLPLICAKTQVSEDVLTGVCKAAFRAQAQVLRRDNVNKKGYIIKKVIQRTSEEGVVQDQLVPDEFQPMLLKQHAQMTTQEFPSFNKACDEYFSSVEGSELSVACARKEREARAKLDNVKSDHRRRIQDLRDRQRRESDIGRLIELNKVLVDGALLVVRSALANKVSWIQLDEVVSQAQERGDPVALAIRALKLKTNTITMMLSDPYKAQLEDDLLLESDEEGEDDPRGGDNRPVSVDINLDISALANARFYFDLKRQAQTKERKTEDASAMAITNAEKTTLKMLKDVSKFDAINKTRKLHWFEKFYWFISSENYLVLGGRDSQQNEQLVKRHLSTWDAYLHADLHGAPSVVVKNPHREREVPPTTLNEAGVMAICYSKGWEEKVVTSAWWVTGAQVSKTAPSGEYLTTGGFMVRGKRRFLPPAQLAYGFGFLFRLEESSIARHEGERKVRSFLNDDSDKEINSENKENKYSENNENKYSKINEINEDKTSGINEDKNSESNEDNNSENSENKYSENTDKNNDIQQDDKSDDDSENSDEETSDKSEEIDENDEIKNNNEELDKLEENEENSDNDEVSFPDTQLKMSHIKGNVFTFKPQLTENPVKAKVYFSAKNQMTKTKDMKKPVEKKEEEKTKKLSRTKMKQKKKFDQMDDEDKQLRNELLQPSGSLNPKEKKKDKKARQKIEVAKKLEEKKTRQKTAQLKSKPIFADINADVDIIRNTSENLENLKLNKKSGENTDNSGDLQKPAERIDEQDDDLLEEDENNPGSDDLGILSSFTAKPFEEDELLYAVPVCAPYQAMHSYRFKIKLLPGPGKKGKACKTALSLFMSDKATLPRHKDLIRAVKDHELNKNFPGKVKVSAPNMSKIKK